MGSDPAIHGVEPVETGIWMDIANRVSRDTNSCALRGHLLLRTSHLVLPSSCPAAGVDPPEAGRPSARGSRSGRGPIELAQSVAPPADVEHVASVQQAIEDRGREHLVSGGPPPIRSRSGRYPDVGARLNETGGRLLLRERRGAHQHRACGDG